MSYKIIQGDCEKKLLRKDLEKIIFFKKVDLSFIDPPFNQDKFYHDHFDNMPPEEYWNWMKRVMKLIYDISSPGGAIYFMQREKNTEYVLECLRSTKWVFQNLIIWKKKTSAVPGINRYGKRYQIIAFATKTNKPRVFNKLRINPPLLKTEKYIRPNGIYVTDVWDDIRELTSGYFGGPEVIREPNGEKSHKQQTPIELLMRIILSSSKQGDLVLDPFAGAGTTTVVAEQLKRNSISIELSARNIELINKRISSKRDSDDILRFRDRYKFTKNLDSIWPLEINDYRKQIQEELRVKNKMFA